MARKVSKDSGKPDGEIFENMPPGATRRQVVTGWQSRDRIWEWAGQGRSDEQIAVNVHVKPAVVRHIRGLRPAPSVPPSVPAPAGRAQGGPPARADPAGSSPAASPVVSPGDSLEVSPVVSRDSRSDSPYASPAPSPDSPGVSPAGSPFTRRDPTLNELDRARVLMPEMKSLHASGASFSEIARKYRLPIATIEAMIGPQSATDFPSGSWGLDVSEREIQTRGGFVVADSITKEIERIVKLSGGGPNQAALIAERFAYYRPDDYTALERILLESGATPATARSAIGLYRERTGEVLGKPGRDEERDDDSPRARMRELDRRQLDTLSLREYEARVKLLEREASGQPATPSAPSPEVAELREEVRRLKELVNLRERDEAVRSATQPLHARIHELESGRARESPEVEAERAATTVKTAAQSRAVDIASDRLEKAPTVMALLNTPRGRKVAAVLDARVDELAKEYGVETEGVRLIEPSEDEMKAALARLEGALGQTEPPAPPPAPAPGAHRVRIPVPRPEPEQSSIEISGTGGITSR